jgi:ABC-2 type transport system permease protein
VEYDEYTIIKNREVAAAPEKIISFFSSQSMSIPIVIMIMIVTSGGIVISSMGMEKENKTLETLLTLPIKRSYIVTGKIIGATIVGAIIAFLYMLGLRYYISSFGMQEKLAGFNLNGMDYALISISLFFSLLAGLSLCLVIGSFAKNYKSAQILSLPVSILAIIPMFILMFQDFSSMSTPLKAIIFSIPFSHPMMAPSLLLLDEYSLVVYGIVYSAIFSIICILIATWIFKTDLLITGRIRK